MAQEYEEYLVGLDDNSTAQDITAAKKQATDQGGTIVKDSTLYPGFTVRFKKGTVHTLDQAAKVTSVERGDKTFTTQ